jgi:hypothetical protein
MNSFQLLLLLASTVLADIRSKAFILTSTANILPPETFRFEAGGKLKIEIQKLKQTLPDTVQQANESSRPVLFFACSDTAIAVLSKFLI